MSYVLDTSVLIAPPQRSLVGRLAVSAASLAELHFGVLMAPDDDLRAARLARLSTVERHLPILDFDARAAAVFGRLSATLHRAGRQPRRRAMDLVIAATASVHECAVVTRNAGDFAGLDGLVDVVVLDESDRR